MGFLMLVSLTESAVYFDNKKIQKDNGSVTITPSPLYGGELSIAKNDMRHFIADCVLKDREPVRLFKERFSN